MTAILRVREVGQREFVQHNGEFEDDANAENPATQGSLTPLTAEQKACELGEKLCREGNVEAFQVFALVTAKQRVWKLEEIS